MVIIAGVLGICLGLIIGFGIEYAKNRDKEEKEKMRKVKLLVINNVIKLIPRLKNKQN